MHQLPYDGQLGSHPAASKSTRLRITHGLSPGLHPVAATRLGSSVAFRPRYPAGGIGFGIFILPLLHLYESGPGAVAIQASSGGRVEDQASLGCRMEIRAEFGLAECFDVLKVPFAFNYLGPSNPPNAR